MTFIIVLLSLLVERFFDYSPLRSWRWLSLFQWWLHRNLGKLSPYLILAINLLVPLLLVVEIHHLLINVFYNVFTIIFSLVIMLYCFGPNNFWVNVDRQIADPKQLFFSFNNKVFGVLFWFICLGPAGAVFYRMTDLSKRNMLDPNEALVIDQIHQLLDWLPVRLLTLLFALGGHFSAVYSVIKNYWWSNPAANETLLNESGRAALAIDEQNVTGVLDLLDRSLTIALVIIAVVVLIA